MKKIDFIYYRKRLNMMDKFARIMLVVAVLTALALTGCSEKNEEKQNLATEKTSVGLEK